MGQRGPPLETRQHRVIDNPLIPTYVSGITAFSALPNRGDRNWGVSP